MKSRWGKGPSTAGMAGLLLSRAKGRLPRGEMNKTEAKFDQHLNAQLMAGQILWYGFQCMAFRLAKSVTLNPDFFILQPDMELQVIDVKGNRVEDDSAQKYRMAAQLVPLRFFFARPRLVRDGGGWDITQVGA